MFDLIIVLISLLETGVEVVAKVSAPAVPKLSVTVWANTQTHVRSSLSRSLCEGNRMLKGGNVRRQPQMART